MRILVLAVIMVAAAGYAGAQDAAAPNIQDGIVSGVVIGEGTEFAVRNNAYPNFKLTASERIRLQISVTDKVIIYGVEKTGASKSNVEFTLSGLPEGLQLFRHVGDRRAETPLTVKDGVIRYREEIGKKAHDMLTMARSTLYLDHDLTLTGDYVDSIVVTADGVTIDGAGYTLNSDSGSAGLGIWIAGHHDVTIKNLKIRGFQFPIYLQDADHTTVQGCTLEPAGWGSGVQSLSSDYNTYEGNTITIGFSGFVFSGGAHNNIVKDCVFNYPGVPAGDPPFSDIRMSAIAGHDMDDFVIQGNTISAQSQAALDYGIMVVVASGVPLPTEYWENDNVTVTGNQVTGATNAVHLTSVRGTVRDNTLNGMNADLRLRGNTQVTVYHNNFLGAASPKVVSLADTPTTELSFDGKGNFYGRSFWPYWQSDDTSSGLVDSFAYGAQDGWLDTERPPDAPADLTVTAGSVANYLSWTAVEDAAESYTGVGAYVIERTIGADGSFSPLATISAASCWYTDADVAAGTIYRYAVSAMDRGRNVGPSGTVGATQDVTPPTVAVEFPSGSTTTSGSLDVVIKIGDTQSSIASAKYQIDQNPWVDLDVIPGTPGQQQEIPLTLTQLSVGLHWLYVSATDEPANEGTAQAGFEVKAMTPAQQLKKLIETVATDAGITNEGIGAALLSKLRAAQRSIANGNIKVSMNQLNALARNLSAQAGKFVSVDAAHAMTSEIAGLISCFDGFVLETAGGRIAGISMDPKGCFGDSLAVQGGEREASVFFNNNFPNAGENGDLQAARDLLILWSKWEPIAGAGAPSATVMDVITTYWIEGDGGCESLHYEISGLVEDGTHSVTAPDGTTTILLDRIVTYGAAGTKEFGYRWVLQPHALTFLALNGKARDPSIGEPGTPENRNVLPESLHVKIEGKFNLLLNGAPLVNVGSVIVDIPKSDF